MSAPLKKVFLLGCGCFNPPTIMHLRMFEVAKDYLESLEQRPHRVLGGILSPAHDNYGKKGLIAGSHRGEMARLAVKSSSFVRLSTWELDQEKWTRTRQVLDGYQDLIKQYGASSIPRPHWIAPEYSTEDIKGASIYLLCGDDLVDSFNVPDLWSEEDKQSIVKNYGLVVLSRGEARPQEMVNGSDLLFYNQENLHFVLSNMGTDISSTKIRQALQRKQSVRYMVPDDIVSYIKTNDLYV
ncbi:hypothetical protein TCAL_00729 [Tigriopus californicus]|uniref:Nicotinamide-nucleotide adenylyltransferase n=1 Tax=Tigriopus californicus TaxID=6832 RepID=A0A553PCU6_TIGCA|nr:nicotinamide/nicotinic acid mononucleotide adenylyltransferase 1-like [Tigriopus californicus]TRY75505.1 hypothetical protein TCAL_00729 [Tigriopus californicus]|eukprot:TCALIF_00729-PA protein Name:"Similar to NMNAT1 Nicotinamide mononucleotide adenylyltransferase 1 (Bos taurus)" AED:0.03 eAED:0.03 QI:232/1/1/1/0.75/0.8/5/1479/239